MSDFTYDQNANELDSRLEEVMDSHKAEKAAAVKRAEMLSTEPPALDRLAGPSAGEQVKSIKGSKTASDIIKEEMVRDRLRKVASVKMGTVDAFLKEAGLSPAAIRQIGAKAMTPAAKQLAHATKPLAGSATRAATPMKSMTGTGGSFLSKARSGVKQVGQQVGNAARKAGLPGPWN